MDALTDILLEATNSVSDQYFRVEIAGGNPKYSERVYCYELYHQMRSLWPREKCPYAITGELNKGGHPILQKLKGADRTIPDFLVHKPGDMAENYAVFEVKQIENISERAIEQDLHKLCLFRREVDYRRAIYLIFGYKVGKKTIETIQAAADKVEHPAPVELWLHSEPLAPAEKMHTLFETSLAISEGK